MKCAYIKDTQKIYIKSRYARVKNLMKVKQFIQESIYHERETDIFMMNHSKKKNAKNTLDG